MWFAPKQYFQEKDHQVKNVGSTYRKARRVHIYIAFKFIFKMDAGINQSLLM